MRPTILGAALGAALTLSAVLLAAGAEAPVVAPEAPMVASPEASDPPTPVVASEAPVAAPEASVAPVVPVPAVVAPAAPEAPVVEPPAPELSVTNPPEDVAPAPVVGGHVLPSGEHIDEDDPRWDCRTMGNLMCGVLIHGTWYVVTFAGGEPVSVARR